MRSYLLLSLLLLTTQIKCIVTKGQSNTQLNKYELSPKLLSEWKFDKNGCLRLRCKYSDSISTNKSIIGISKKIFLNLFGKPDDYGADKNILVYYLCTECDEKKKVLRESDSSWIVFYFREGKLEKCTLQIQ
jgi:hypothetical protein